MLIRWTACLTTAINEGGRPRRERIADPLPYSTTLALIRTCGTGAGDALSHRFGFGPSTLVTGFAFIVAVTYFYIVRRNNQIVVGVPAGETA
jgi:hypothetical protein